MPLEAILSPVDAFKSEMGVQVALGVENPSMSFLMGLKAHYLQTCDPAEYRFATRHYPGGWQAWRRLQLDPEAMAMIGQWREELWAKLRSDSYRRILEAAQGETRDALGANKYIYESFEPLEKNSVGRPSKEKIKKEAERLVEDERIKDDAYNRIFNAQEAKEIKEEY